MAPTILIVGATGNTGRGVVETLSKLLTTSKTLSGHRLLAQTRSSSSPAAQALAQLPGVSLVEKNWATITPEWLRENEVVRAFIASHTEPTQFTEESAFHNAALRAGVEYVVRIGTTAPNTRPDCEAYYARNHWAIETMLASPAFAGYHWTSLQPNAFTGLWLSGAAEFVKQYRKTGKQEGPLKMIAAADAPVAVVNPDEIGALAAHLLSLEDPAVHSGKKLVVNGPEDITGEQIVKLVEQHIGVPVENVSFKDTGIVDYMASVSPFPKEIILSIRHALKTGWAGEWVASTVSKEVLEIAPPKQTPAEGLKALLGE
jgi:uncharacterized protein YbjT (DUF2867 family)